MCALQSAALSFRRLRCTARAASTRFLISREGSASAFPESSAYSSAGTSTAMSMRSSSGPETRARYFFSSAGEQVHFRVGCPYQPQRQGFMAQTSMNRLGYVAVPATRATVTTPSSSGCLSASRTSRWNSGSSSKNSTPLCARLISPGCSCAPPDMAAAEIVWCGERKGRSSTTGLALLVSPATEWISVVCSISARLMSGSMEVMRLASMLLPAPGGPTMSMLCPPAAATSSARLTLAWPLTSAKSGPPARRARMSGGSACSSSVWPRKYSSSCVMSRAP